MLRTLRWLFIGKGPWDARQSWQRTKVDRPPCHREPKGRNRQRPGRRSQRLHNPREGILRCCSHAAAGHGEQPNKHRGDPQSPPSRPWALCHQVCETSAHPPRQRSLWSGKLKNKNISLSQRDPSWRGPQMKFAKATTASTAGIIIQPARWTGSATTWRTGRLVTGEHQQPGWGGWRRLLMGILATETFTHQERLRPGVQLMC